jgi:Kef-type K+ transport system membrane component KefB
MILGYLVAGFVIGPAMAGLITSTQTIAILSELGIAFLLFIVGLELDMSRIRDSGVKAAVIGTTQVLFTGGIGYVLAGFFGFSQIASFYIAAALTFSSTMIVVKLLADKNELDTVHGRIILGMLLIQDVIAIFILALLPNLGLDASSLLASSLGKGILMFAAGIVIAKLFLSRLFSFAARSTELLFLTAVTWLFSLSFLADRLGYSIAIGSFIAGVTLASSSYKLEVASRVRPLRDFFATIFFVSLGMQLSLPSVEPHIIGAAVAFSLFVIIGNPLIVFFISLLLGYNNRISMLTGLPIGQISEFSLILIALGLKLGHINAQVSAMIALVAALTITVTTYVIKYDEQIYRFVKHRLGWKIVESSLAAPAKGYDVVICGYNRIGYSIVRKLQEMRKSFIVLDFNPDVITQLKRQRIPCMYGDVGDIELLRQVKLSQAKVVVSTVPSVYDNELILKETRREKSIVIVTANQIKDALHLYDAGASYVILPHFLGGEHVALLLEKFKDTTSILQYKFSHIRELHQRRQMGHEHPRV